MPGRWPIAALLASAFMLAAAHAFEAYGYPPCKLCYDQRNVYWAVIAISIAALILQRVKSSDKIARIFAVLLGLAFLWGAGVAFYHAGVEWKFWPGPATCTGGAGRWDNLDVGKALEGPQLVVMCDEAAWRLLGLSMAGYNGLISAGLGALSFIAASRGAKG
ncbi:MAG: disulfide bond formation protein B [Caulobacterales bacterium]